jgi:mannitol-specific phosphotransferase system IIBC component
MFLIDVFHLCVFLLYVLSVVTGVIEPATVMTTVIHKSRGGIDMNTIAGIIVALLSSFILSMIIFII